MRGPGIRIHIVGRRDERVRRWKAAEPITHGASHRDHVGIPRLDSVGGPAVQHPARHRRPTRRSSSPARVNVACPPVWSRTTRTAPSTNSRRDCAALCRRGTRAPAGTPRMAPTMHRSAPHAAHRLPRRHRRSRTLDPTATPTRRRGPHSGPARARSLPGRPPLCPQNPQPMSELRNHPRKLPPDTATYTWTEQFFCTPLAHSSASFLRADLLHPGNN
ncbi:hypothetical protein ABIA39_004504 [Nocardia sp. GAS34]